MKKICSFIIFLMFALSAIPAWASNVRITEMPRIMKDEGSSTSLLVKFGVSWDFSWRTHSSSIPSTPDNSNAPFNDPYNWDAIWVFVKYKQADGTTSKGTGYRGMEVNTNTNTISVLRAISYRGAIDGAEVEDNKRDLWTGARGCRTAEYR